MHKPSNVSTLYIQNCESGVHSIIYRSLRDTLNQELEQLYRAVANEEHLTVHNPHCLNMPTIEGVRARVSQPSIYNSLPVCSTRTFRTYWKENRQELYIEGWPTLTLTPSIGIQWKISPLPPTCTLALLQTHPPPSKGDLVKNSNTIRFKCM